MRDLIARRLPRPRANECDQCAGYRPFCADPEGCVGRQQTRHTTSTHLPRGGGPRIPDPRGGTTKRRHLTQLRSVAWPDQPRRVSLRSPSSPAAVPCPPSKMRLAA